MKHTIAIKVGPTAGQSPALRLTMEALNRGCDFCGRVRHSTVCSRDAALRVLPAPPLDTACALHIALAARTHGEQFDVMTVDQYVAPRTP